LEVSTIIGGISRCKNCNWEGTEGPLVANFDLPGSDDERIHKYVSDVRRTIAGELVSVELGKLMLRWGFITKKGLTAQTMGRYLNGIARAVATSIIEVRDQIEREEDAKSKPV
jgi:hypothetical protein